MSPLPVPEFRPSASEFADFDAFVRRIEPLCPAGAATVRPPFGWAPRANTRYDDLDRVAVRAPIRQEVVGSKGVFVAMHVVQPRRSLAEFRREAHAYAARAAPPPLRFVHAESGVEGFACDGAAAPGAVATEESLARLDAFFWRNVMFRKPMYGADLEGSLFEDDVCEQWNLKHLETILDHAPAVSGVHRPYLYVGMFGSLFCFHVEDGDLYGINYLHTGAPKTWYTVPLSHRDRFDSLCERLYPDHFANCNQFMRHKQMLVSLDVLRKHDIPYGRVTQLPGTFTIVFPGVYHCGFNHGFNIAEAVNFASLRWLNLGKKATACHCRKDTVRLDVEAIDRAIFPGKYTAQFALKAQQIERTIDLIREGKTTRARNRALKAPAGGASSVAASAEAEADLDEVVPVASAAAGAPSAVSASLPASAALAANFPTSAGPHLSSPTAASPQGIGAPTCDATTPARPVVPVEAPPSIATTVPSDSEVAPVGTPPTGISPAQRVVAAVTPGADKGSSAVGLAAPACSGKGSPALGVRASEDQHGACDDIPPSSADAGSSTAPLKGAVGSSEALPQPRPPKRRRNWAPIPRRSMADCVIRKNLTGQALERAKLDRATMCGIEMQFLTASTLLNTVNVVLRDSVNARTIAALGRRMSKTRRRFLLVQTAMFDFVPSSEQSVSPDAKTRQCDGEEVRHAEPEVPCKGAGGDQGGEPPCPPPSHSLVGPVDAAGAQGIADRDASVSADVAEPVVALPPPVRPPSQASNGHPIGDHVGGLHGPAGDVDDDPRVLMNMPQHQGSHHPGVLDGMDGPVDVGLGIGPAPSQIVPTPIAPSPIVPQHHVLGPSMYGVPPESHFPPRPADMLSISPPLRPPTPLELAVQQVHRQQQTQPLLKREATAALAMVDGWGGSGMGGASLSACTTSGFGLLGSESDHVKMPGWGDGPGAEGAAVGMHGDGLQFGDRILADEKI